MKTYELVIIGGGSAGMAAALEAKKCGINSILVIERGPELGGVLLQCIHNGFGIKEFNEELSGPEYAQRFINQMKVSGITYLTNSMVLNLNRDKSVTYSNEVQGQQTVQAKAVILSTGCRERTCGSLAIPGTRPAGIWTAGTAQRYMNIDGMSIGRKAFILGSGDIGLIMARRMTLEGSKVLGVAEIMPYSKGLPRNIMQCLKDFNIPLFLSHTIVKIEGKNRLEAVTIAKVDDQLKPIHDTEKRFECDSLLISAGLIPENTLLEEAGIPLDSKTKGALVDEYLQTDIPGIFSCGNSLHVHDIVDNVTSEARKVGHNAAVYIKNHNLAKEGINAAFSIQPAKTSQPSLSNNSMTCIVCPNGCELHICKSEFGREPVILGNKCPRGRQFALDELTNPTRTLTTTVAIKKSTLKRLPVISSSPLPKNKIFKVRQLLSHITVEAPIHAGQVILHNVLDLGIDIIATRECPIFDKQ